MFKDHVAIFKSEKCIYPFQPPYNPSYAFPEYPFGISSISLSNVNEIYSGIRDLFYQLGYDRDNFSKKEWNPLGVLIKPGQKILLKPNFVNHENPLNDDIESLLTHGSIIRAVLDFVFIALKGEGEIIIADSPIQSANFNKILAKSGIKDIITFYKENANIKITCLDLRKEIAIVNKKGDVTKRINNHGDPLGYTLVDLKQESLFFPVLKMRKNKFRGLDYNIYEVMKYHNNKNNSYLISNTVLNCDAIINLPKLKTHKLAGFTGSLKNLVGILGQKECFPHFSIGSPQEFGDQYPNPSLRKRVITKSILDNDIISTSRAIINSFIRLSIRISNKIKPYKDYILIGNWFGNDTVWRGIIDLNRIVLFSDKTGNILNNKSRKYLSIVDAIISGEKEGPLIPSRKGMGFLISGINPVSVDLVCSVLAGFDYLKIPTIHNAIEDIWLKSFENTDEIKLSTNISTNISFEDLSNLTVPLIPSAGWQNIRNCL